MALDRGLVFLRMVMLKYSPELVMFLDFEFWTSLGTWITDEGLVTEMRIWSILLIKSDLKWCIHLSKSLFLKLKIKNYLHVLKF